MEIDNLTYKYDSSDNKLKGVHDSSNSSQGFKDKSGSTLNDVDYTYDNNGNMITDANKGITSIKYNHLNLPTEIVFNNVSYKKINYLYNTQGVKLQKIVINGSSIVTTDYLDGFQHKGEVLQFFPHAEGYVTNTQTIKNDGSRKDNYNYVFNYLDHLGNVRVSYAWDYELNVLKIIEENGYYPFGLKHSGYNSDLKIYKAVLAETKVELKAIPGGGVTVEQNAYNFKYQSQERQNELGLNWDSFKWRNYDYAIGRFMNIDPLSEKYAYQSHYNFSENRVIDAFELEGLEAVQVKDTQSKCIDVTVKVQPINNTLETFAPMTNDQVATAMGNFVSQTNSSYSGENLAKEQINFNVIIDPSATLTATFQPLVINSALESTAYTDQILTASAPGFTAEKDHGNTQTGNMQISSRNTMPHPEDKPAKPGMPVAEKAAPGHTISHEFGHIFGLEHDDKSAKKPGNLMEEGSPNSSRTITPAQRTKMLDNIPEERL